VPGQYYYLDVSGTLDVTSSSYLANSGTIRVGANSAAVEITGAAAGDDGRHIFNSGTIDARQDSSTALRVNTDNRLGSYALNVGTIAGSIAFGAGDDRLTNTLLIDNSGRVTSAGNLVMNGSVIDFGAGDDRFENDRGDHDRRGRQPDHRRERGHDSRQHRGPQQRRRRQPDDSGQPLRRLRVRRRLRRARFRPARHRR
jgi:hypothetical protein